MPDHHHTPEASPAANDIAVVRPQDGDGAGEGAAAITADLKHRIARRYRRQSGATTIPQHVVLFEVPVDAPAERLGRHGRRIRRGRVDALAIGQWGPATGRLLGFEIKATRADLMVELRDPLKAEGGARYCHEWWLVVADKEMIAGLELPPSWGLLAPSGRGLRVARCAERRTPEPPTSRLLATIAASSTTQAIANDGRGLFALAHDLDDRHGATVAELAALRRRLDAERAERLARLGRCS